MPDYDIVEAIARVEDEMIDSMIRNLSRHHLEEIVEKMNWEQWQVVMLAELEKYKRRNAKKYGTVFEDINSRIESLIRKANENGQSEQEKKILEAIKKGFKGYRDPNKGLTAQFFHVNDRKMEALINATINDMQKAETAILRMANDQFRRIIFDAQVYAATGAATYKKAVDMATKDMLAAGLNCVEYKNGARHRLDDYAEMAIRTASKRAYLSGEGVMRQKWGISLVIINKRQAACPKCAPFVGKIMIDDVWSGGSREDGEYPLMSEAVAAGLYHPRCKDAHSTYFKGISRGPGNGYTQEELEDLQEQSSQEARQQYAERQVEKYERLEKYSLDKENIKCYQERKVRWKDLIDAQHYKKVIFGKDVITKQRNNVNINIRKCLNTNNNIYVSDRVKIKPKQLHIIDNNVSKALKILGLTDNDDLPQIIIINEIEMQSNAIAGYNPVLNIIFINENTGNINKLIELQNGCVCEKNPISTLVHEYIHFKDSTDYRRKFGDIKSRDDYLKYINWINKKSKKQIDKLEKRGYNVINISEYGNSEYETKNYNETYTEYRAKKALEG